MGGYSISASISLLDIHGVLTSKQGRIHLKEEINNQMRTLPFPVYYGKFNYSLPLNFEMFMRSVVQILVTCLKTCSITDFVTEDLHFIFIILHSIFIYIINFTKLFYTIDVILSISIIRYRGRMSLTI